MLRHASHSGVSVFEETRVTDIQFKDQDGSSRPFSATWRDKKGVTDTVSFDFVIDATGRNGLLSVKYLHNRKYNVGLKNMAMWGYWNGAGTYKPAPKDGTPFFEALLGIFEFLHMMACFSL